MSIIDTLDRRTPEFKGLIETHLSGQTRLVFAHVAIHQEPVTAAQVAAATRLHSTQASAVLIRLCKTGFLETVSPADGTKRRGYRVADPMLHAYCLFRLAGVNDTAALEMAAARPLTPAAQCFATARRARSEAIDAEIRQFGIVR